MRNLKLILLLLLGSIASAQTVTIAERLLDSQGNDLVGTIDISNRAFLLPTGSTCTVTAASNATPIQIDCSASHGFTTGWTVYVTGVLGNTAANGTWTLTVVDADSFTLDGSVGNGAWASGGTAQRRIPVGAKHQRYPANCTVTAATNASPIAITCSANHNLVTGARMTISGVLGNTAANGTFYITRTGATTFTLDGSTGNGTYTSGGVASGVFVGNISIPLYPTTTAEAIPGGGAAGFTYAVTYNLADASNLIESWNIPPTPTQTTRSAVVTPGVVNPTATLNPANISGSGASDTRNAKITWNGAQAAWYLTDWPINAQTGTTYTVPDSDRMKNVQFSNTSAIAVTLPQAGASGAFLSGWMAVFSSINTGEVTITPTTSTIDGQATLKLRVGMSAFCQSDGTNYSCQTWGGTNGANFANNLRALASATAAGNVNGSASELTIIGTVAGTKTLPANFHDAPGSGLRVHAEGFFSNTGTPTLTVKLKYGANVLASTGAVTTTTGATNWLWFFDGWVTCRTTGTSGTVVVQGQFILQNSATPSTMLMYPMLNTGTVTVNTTTTNVVDITVQWGTGSASNTITSSGFFMFPVATPL